MTSLSRSLHTALWFTAASLITACSSGGDGPFSTAPEADDVVAVVAARAPDFSSGAVSLVNGGTFAAQNNLGATISDIRVRVAGDQYFVIERFGSNQIKRFNLSAPNNATLTASTQGDGDTGDSNPADLLIVSPSKGYLLRYGSGSLWIVNPSATDEAGFYQDEIDLSHYDADGVPEMIAAVIDNGRLFVALQRLEGFAAVKSGYVAVIDLNTDEEIITGEAEALPGIELPFRNPTGLVLDQGSAGLLVIASGGFDGSFNPVFEGGIARIHNNNFSVESLLEDGTADNAPFGQFGELAAVTGDRAYFTAGTPFGPQTLYRFNPTNDTTPVAVDGFAEVEIGPLAVDPLDRLWVGRAETAAPGLNVLDFVGGQESVVDELIDTELTPINIDFLIAP